MVPTRTTFLVGTSQQLQATGGHVWNFILVRYASFVVMRIRRETDGQGNTLSKTRLDRKSVV